MSGNLDSTDEPIGEPRATRDVPPPSDEHSRVALFIRPATGTTPPIARTVVPTIRAGETYALERDITEADALAYWLGRDRSTFVAEEGGAIVGTYYLRANAAAAAGTSAAAAT